MIYWQVSFDQLHDLVFLYFCAHEVFSSGNPHGIHNLKTFFSWKAITLSNLLCLVY